MEDMDEKLQLPEIFLAHAADILGDTNSGLTGSQITRIMRGYGMQFGVEIPHVNYPFDAPNKRTALLENLRPFSGVQQHEIIRDLCDHPALPPGPNAERDRLKLQLATSYASYAAPLDLGSFKDGLVDETKHWLDSCAAAREVYVSAVSKYSSGVFNRNLLDDLRLSLELLIRDVCKNKKSLENQLPEIGKFLKTHGGSPQLGNMFSKLIEYFCVYQNEYIKHNDSVNNIEIDFIMEITSAFMKHVVRMSRSERS